MKKGGKRNMKQEMQHTEKFLKGLTSLTLSQVTILDLIGDKRGV
jgi:hypothetical protein